MSRKPKPVRSGTQVHAILSAVGAGRESNAAVCEAVDEIGPYLARTMAKLIARDLVVNVNPGRGERARYRITDAGRRALGAAA